MPISKENKKRYPANWKDIADSIREREGNRCKRCNAKNGDYIKRAFIGDRASYQDSRGFCFDAENGSYQGLFIFNHYKIKSIKIVLTVAHLNHIPEDCRPENLEALCQRCHLRYDIDHHKTTRRSSKFKNQPELPL